MIESLYRPCEVILEKETLKGNLVFGFPFNYNKIAQIEQIEQMLRKY